MIAKQTEKGYFLENILFNFSRLARGFFHSGVFMTHLSKIRMLISLECIFVVFCLMMRKAFTNGLTFVVYLSYDLVFLVLNIMLLFEGGKTDEGMVKSFGRIDYIIIVLFVVILAKWLLGFWQTLKEMIKTCKENKV